MSTVAVSFDLSSLRSHATKAFAGILLFAGLVSVAHCGGGCLPAYGPTEADRNYRLELTECSRTAPTPEAAKACRKAVNARYGLCERADWPKVSPCDEMVGQ